MAVGLYEEAEKRFHDVFGEGDVKFVRAPGRVNIIGEHTDYNGLSVFPMALDREIAIAISPRSDSHVALANVVETAPLVEFDLSAEIPPYEAGHWGNYIKAAAQALWEWAKAHCPESLPLKGLNGCVAGSLPAGSGLSSSSALVVAAATALVEVNKLNIAKPVLADLMAKGERYVGTEGGGMDQAASILAKKGYALKIDFFPLRTTPAKLPEGCEIVIGNSMVEAKKAGAARSAYNTRVAECKLGLAMLRKIVSDQNAKAQAASLLKEFYNSVPDWADVVDAMPDGAMSLSSIADWLGGSEDTLRETCLKARDGSILEPPAAGFKPKMRVRHVLTEGHRVELAAKAMEQGDAVELGRLMNESHESCAGDYEVSCTELDELVSDLRSAGALGARLTGAGFGGCTVSLVRTENVPKVLDTVWQAYYVKRGISEDRRDEVLFSCSPAAGAGVVELS